MVEYLSFEEVAAKLECRPSKVRQLVLEDRVLIATRINPNGVVIESGAEDEYGLSIIDHLDDAGAISTDIYKLQPTGETVLTSTQHIGYLRIERNALAAFTLLNSDFATPSSTSRPVNEIVVAASDGPAPLKVNTHSTKTRRNALTPVIEKAQKQCSDPQDTAEVWAVLLVLAENKAAPLIGATEDGLQYFKNGTAASFNREALRKRLRR